MPIRPTFPAQARVSRLMLHARRRADHPLRMSEIMDQLLHKVKSMIYPLIEKFSGVFLLHILSPTSEPGFFPGHLYNLVTELTLHPSQENQVNFPLTFLSPITGGVVMRLRVQGVPPSWTKAVCQARLVFLRLFHSLAAFHSALTASTRTRRKDTLSR